MKFVVIVAFLLAHQCSAQYGAVQHPVTIPPTGYGAAPNPYGAPRAPVKTGYNVPDETAAEAAGAGFEEPSTTTSTSTTTQTTTVTTTRSPFPLPECYINEDGFLCCNKNLERLMRAEYDKLAASRDGKWKKCNREQVNIAIQRAAETRFNHKFELVTGAGDYASKNNFDGDLICKIKREKSIILAYGTPNFG